MNKKGQVVFLNIMIAIMVFIVAVVFIAPLKDIIIDARDVDNLDCINQSISVSNRMTCILVDMWLFYFVGTVIAVGITFITGKRILSGMK